MTARVRPRGIAVLEVARPYELLRLCSVGVGNADLRGSIRWKRRISGQGRVAFGQGNRFFVISGMREGSAMMEAGVLRDRIAIVTGAASGIGAGISVAYAAEGARVALVDKVPEALARPVLDAVREMGSEPFFYQCDVSNEVEVVAMTRTVLDHFGHVDILVNNAGIFTESSVAEMPIADWDLVLNVNLRGTFLCTRFILNHMLERGSGRIINMASQLGQIGGADVAHYSASKGGVIAFTKALAREVSTSGVLVNAIAPGPIKTPLLDNETDEWRNRKLGELPIGRFGEVSEVTPTAILLASDAGSYYVGQTLGPNGGDVML